MLASLKALGVRIAIDDFGTGYSSLSYIGRLPIDELKIDRSFVAELGKSTKAGALAASVVQLGLQLDLVTVAEGIEEETQLEQLRALGCQLAQGYLIARPMPAIHVPGLVRRHEAPPITVPTLVRPQALRRPA